MTEPTVTPEKAMADSYLFPWWLVLVWGILSVLIGMMFLISPAVTLVILITFMGAYWFVGGLFTLISLAVDKSNMGWKIFISILSLLAGIVILVQPIYSALDKILVPFFVIFLGFWGCFIGGAKLYQAFFTKDAGTGIVGIIGLIFGVLVLIFPFAASLLVPLVVGVFFLVAGILAIVISFSVKKVLAAST